MSKKLVLKRIGIGIAAAVVLYTLAGFLIVPMAAEWFINSRLGEKIGRPVRVSNVHVNPWTLAGGLDGLTIDSLPDTSEKGIKGPPEPLFSVTAIQVDLAVSSLFKFCPVVTQVVVDSPRFRVERHLDNTLSITDIIQRFSANTPAESSAGETPPPPPFRLSNLKLLDGRILFKDHIAHREHRIDAVSLDLPMVSNLPKERHIPVEGRIGLTFNGGEISLFLKGLPFTGKRSGNLN